MPTKTMVIGALTKRLWVSPEKVAADPKIRDICCPPQSSSRARVRFASMCLSHLHAYSFNFPISYFRENRFGNQVAYGAITHGSGTQVCSQSHPERVPWA